MKLYLSTQVQYGTKRRPILAKPAPHLIQIRLAQTQTRTRTSSLSPTQPISPPPPTQHRNPEPRNPRSRTLTPCSPHNVAPTQEVSRPSRYVPPFLPAHPIPPPIIPQNTPLTHQSQQPARPGAPFFIAGTVPPPPSTLTTAARTREPERSEGKKEEAGEGREDADVVLRGGGI